MTNRKYIKFDISRGYPAGSKIRYECGICGVTLASMPAHSAACKCRNIIVDAEAGRVAVKEPSKFLAYESE
jgi:hypothetical protein